MKKLLAIVLGILVTCSCLPFLTGCECKHEYEEKQVEATCTAEGYNLFTCSKCGDSYKGDIVTPKKNHSGKDTCSICGTNLLDIWKDFLNKNGNNGNLVITGGVIYIVANYNDDFDCFIYAEGRYTISSESGSETAFVDDRSLTLGYNSYDKKWSWLYEGSISAPNVPSFSALTGNALGSFSEWNSHSASLNCTSKTGKYFDVFDNSTLLDFIKKFYNEALNKINAKLNACGYNISLANFGLEN